MSRQVGDAEHHGKRSWAQAERDRSCCDLRMAIGVVASMGPSQPGEVPLPTQRLPGGALSRSTDTWGAGVSTVPVN